MRRLILMSASLILVLSGCVMFSLNPLSKENESLPDGLPGVWADKETEYTITLSSDKKTYDVIEMELKDQQPLHRRMIVSKVGDSLYASVYIGKNLKFQKELAAYAIPAYQIIRLKLEGDKLAFQLFNPDLLKKLKEIPEPSYVELTEPDDQKSVHIYGANPKELREWLAKYGDKIFTDELVVSFARKKEDGKDALQRSGPASDSVDKAKSSPNINSLSQGESDDVSSYRKRAEQGDAKSQCAMGGFYFDGKGMPQDYVESAKCYRLAADQGDLYAQRVMAKSCFDGRGVPQDYQEAAKWYRLAAEQGDAYAQCALGLSYLLGRGVPQDYAESVKWYRKSAESGDNDAQFALATCYIGGNGVEKNVPEAVKWYQKAAAQGNGSARDALEKLNVVPNPVNKDFAKQVESFRERAAQGDAYAQCAVGRFYFDGSGVPKDYAESAKWYRKAAEQGTVYAQCVLGRFL